MQFHNDESGEFSLPLIIALELGAWSWSLKAKQCERVRYVPSPSHVRIACVCVTGLVRDHS